jgi:hypothetical protein
MGRQIPWREVPADVERTVRRRLEGAMGPAVLAHFSVPLTRIELAASIWYRLLCSMSPHRPQPWTHTAITDLRWGPKVAGSNPVDPTTPHQLRGQRASPSSPRQVSRLSGVLLCMESSGLGWRCCFSRRGAVSLHAKASTTRLSLGDYVARSSVVDGRSGSCVVHQSSGTIRNASSKEPRSSDSASCAMATRLSRSHSSSTGPAT